MAMTVYAALSSRPGTRFAALAARLEPLHTLGVSCRLVGAKLLIRAPNIRHSERERQTCSQGSDTLPAARLLRYPARRAEKRPSATGATGPPTQK
jgi:hypothetical protein